MWETVEFVGKKEDVQDRGFVVVNGHVFMYSQLKRALTNLLVKRVVDERDPTLLVVGGREV